MNTTAAGAYFRTLREDHGWSQAQLAARLTDILQRNINVTTIWRIETGRTRPRTDMLTALLDALSGDIQQVTALLSSDALPEEEGIKAARRSRSTEQDTDLQAAIAVFERLRGDPRSLERWLGYGDRLAEERNTDPKMGE